MLCVCVYTYTILCMYFVMTAAVKYCVVKLNMSLKYGIDLFHLLSPPSVFFLMITPPSSVALFVWFPDDNAGRYTGYSVNVF